MKKTTRVTLSFMVAILAAGCLRRYYIAGGEQAMAAEDYRTAEIYFRKSIQKAPHSDKAFYDLGTAYLQEQDYKFSYMAFSRVFELNQRNGEARVAAGKILLMANQAPKAEQRARAALEYEPICCRQGCCWVRRSWPRIKPTPRAQPSKNLALALCKTKGPAAALDQIREQIKSQPDSADFHALLAVFLTNDHQLDGASAELKTAITKNPNQPVLYFMLAIRVAASGNAASRADTLVNRG